MPKIEPESKQELNLNLKTLLLSIGLVLLLFLLSVSVVMAQPSSGLSSLYNKSVAPDIDSPNLDGANTGHLRNCSDHRFRDALACQ